METQKKGIYEKYVKRILDVTLSLLALIVLSPVLLVTAVRVRFRLGSPVLFEQQRPGRIDPKTGKEKIFTLYKFRSMTDGRDENGNLLPDGIRLTDFGKKLRSTSLDELPELINILKGDMSIVGPRPLLVKYLDRYSERQRRRMEIKPGLTGYAQAYGRNAITWEDKFEKDVYYVEHVGFLLDCRIILQTIKVVFRREGISEAGNATMEEFMGTKKEL